MRTGLEIAQAKDILQRATDNSARAGNSDALVLRMFVDLLGWVQGEPSSFGPQLEAIRKRIQSGVN